MNAPNAPNPANPNAQDPADQNQYQVPVGPAPAQGPIQIVQNVPVLPIPQPVPMQLAPAGVIPAPQIFYQNWIGKKPEISGKPEEDAESHLLNMRDWMEAHNFPEGEKVRHFRVTLIGEARLWYESLALLVYILRDTIDLAKRVLTKEKLDRLLNGQSSTLFMKATSNNDSHSPQNHQKKGVTFDTMETLERNSNCIDRLTSLVSDLKMTMDRKQPQYKPKIYQGWSRNQNAGQQNFTPRNRTLSRGRIQGENRGNYNNRNNYRPNYGTDQEADGTTIGQVIEVVITQITIDKVM